MSDKTTAALAAEQADTEATTTQEAELLPAATLDELEQVDLGTVAEGERAPFRITDDRCADWAIRKIADERSEYDRLKALADEQIAAINEKVAAARKRMENGTSYLTSCLADFFATVPHKETKTTEKYRLLSGTLTFKKGTTKTKLDETKLVPWLKANGYPKMQEALDLIEAWGFKYKSIAFQWIKQNRSGNGYFFGLGRWTRGNTEPCLIAIKGKPKRISAGVGQLVFSPLRRHSQKPAEVRDKIVELMGDLPRIELFAREAAPGWDVWGNEAPTPEVKDAPVDSVELAGKEETHEPDNQRDPAPQL